VPDPFVLLGRVRRRLRHRREAAGVALARVPALALPPALLPSALYRIVRFADRTATCLAGLGAPAWPFALATPRASLSDNVGTAPLAAAPSSINRSALREPLDVKRWLLWGTLVATSLLLGYMALRLSRQVRAGAPDANR
jgi:hypothetical protein